MNPPRGESTGLSWGSAAFRGRGSHRPWVAIGFHPARTAFRRPPGSIRRNLPRSRSHARALHTLSCPFRGVRRSPARSRRPVGRHGEPCNLSWALSALRHTLGAMKRDDRGSNRGPAGRVEVWLPPARPLHRPSRRAKRRSVHGLSPSGRSPRARWCPLSGALPSCRYRPARRTVKCTRGRDRLQGFVLGTGSFGHRPLRAGPSRPSWGSPLQSLLPIRPGTALWSRGLPSHPTHGLTSQPGGVTGSCEADGSAWSVSGLPALLGFVTF